MVVVGSDGGMFILFLDVFFFSWYVGFQLGNGSGRSISGRVGEEASPREQPQRRAEQRRREAENRKK